MYEYRYLSERDRDEVKRIRNAQRYPLHSPPHPRSGGGLFLITAAIFEHTALLSSPVRRTEFELRLLEGFNAEECKAHAWVVLPNHYHVLLSTIDFRVIAGIVKQLHGSTSRQWNLEDNTLGRKVWFRYSGRKIRGERHFLATLNYIHHNPVKHAVVNAEFEWPWSSFHLYLKDRGAEWIEKISRDFPILDYGSRWDE